MSWRIPLGIQLIPGLILAVGTLFLPPSPRLMVLHGRHEDAERSLTMLRGRNGAQGGLVKVGILLSFFVPCAFLAPRLAPPANSCCFAQVELLEMQVETILVQRVDGDRTTKGVFDESRAWKKLFGRKYRDRTMVGVLIMVFQRTLYCCSLLSSGSVWSRLYVCARRLLVVLVFSCYHGAGYDFDMVHHVQCVLLHSSTMMRFILHRHSWLLSPTFG